MSSDTGLPLFLPLYNNSLQSSKLYIIQLQILYCVLTKGVSWKYHYRHVKRGKLSPFFFIDNHYFCTVCNIPVIH